MAIRSAALARGLVLLAAIVVVSLLLLAPGARAGDTLRATGTYVVQTGDTLWEIAGRITPADGDIRRTVHTIQEMNGLEGGILQVGVELTVPR